MRLLLAWAMAQILGAFATLFVAVSRTLHGEPPGSLADRFVWIGLTLTGFVVFDFCRRATSPADQGQVQGAYFAWLTSSNALMMAAFGVVFGMLVSNRPEPLPPDLPEIFGLVFLYALGGAFLLSIAYVLFVERRMVQDARP